MEITSQFVPNKAKEAKMCYGACARPASAGLERRAIMLVQVASCLYKWFHVCTSGFTHVQVVSRLYKWLHALFPVLIPVPQLCHNYSTTYLTTIPQLSHNYLTTRVPQPSHNYFTCLFPVPQLSFVDSSRRHQLTVRCVNTVGQARRHWSIRACR
jgi:hypothetical protein